MSEPKRHFFSLISNYFRNGGLGTLSGLASSLGRRPQARVAARIPGRLDNGHYFLGLQPEIGETYLFKATSQLSFTLDAGMDEKKYGVGLHYDISTVFSRNKAGLLVAELRFKKTQGGTILNEGFASGDTDEEEDDPERWGIMWDIVQNTSLQVTLTPRGAIKSVKGASDMFRQLISRINAIDPAKLPLDLKSWNSWIMQGTLKRWPMRMFQLFPEGEVDGNKTWTIALNEPGVVPLEVMSTFAMENVKDTEIRLKTGGPISCEKVHSDLFYEPSIWTMKGRENGTYTVGMGTGLLSHGHVKGSAEGFYAYFKNKTVARIEYELTIERQDRAAEK